MRFTFTNAITVAAALSLSADSSLPVANAFTPAFSSRSATIIIDPSNNNYANNNNNNKLGAPSSPQPQPIFRSCPTQLLHQAALQPGKGGVVVEAKSDFVARDVLCDAMMGRSSGDGDDRDAGESLVEERDESQPNENLWVFDSKPKRRGVQQPRQQSQAQPQAQSNQQLQMNGNNRPAPPQMPPPPLSSSSSPPQQQQQPPLQPQQAQPQQFSDPTAQFLNNPPKPKSKLPDPSQMELQDIQGELSLRRVDYSDCTDRQMLENKLREGRAAMAAAKGFERSSRRNTNQPTATTQQQQAQAQVRRQSVSVDASTAGQAVFSSGKRDVIRPPAGASTQRTATATATRTATRTRDQPQPTTGNPFASKNRQGARDQKLGGNSSSSFRDNAHGIGFGDVNSYSNAPGRGGGDASVARGGTSGRSAGVGAGVSLGTKKTSYGDFDNNNGGGAGVSIGGEFGVSGGGSNVGGDTYRQGSGNQRRRTNAAPRRNNASSSGGGNIGGSSASFRGNASGAAGNGNNSSFRGNSSSSGTGTGGGGNRRGTGSVSGGGGTSTFSSGGNTGSGGNFGGGGSFNAGGVSMKGDSSIFSSMGFVGQGDSSQGGSTSTFNMGGPSAGGGGGAPARPRVAKAAPPPPLPQQPSMTAADLNFLTQAPPTAVSDAGYDDDMMYSSSNTSPESEASYYNPDNEPPSGDEGDNDDYYSYDHVVSHYDTTASVTSMSNQYQEEGVDILSGGQEGFGVVEGVTRTGGDATYRGTADEVKEDRKKGDLGISMGADFGGSFGGGGSARYSSGRGVGGMELDD